MQVCFSAHLVPEHPQCLTEDSSASVVVIAVSSGVGREDGQDKDQGEGKETLKKRKMKILSAFLEAPCIDVIKYTFTHIL